MTAHIHLVGIGGAGLSAIATVLLQQGYTVSGSDLQASAGIERLRRLGANIAIGHSSHNLTSPDLVVISSAVPDDNPEVVAARKRNIPVQKRPAWLGQMMQGKRGITIAGTHGKTTTTAMVALVLSQADLSPTYIIGGFLPQLNGNAAAGWSDLFIIEADEYDHTFLSLKPEIAVITNIERDHPDIYPTQGALHQAFVDFAGLVPVHGQLIICGDDPGGRKLLSQYPSALTYGLKASNIWQAVDVTLNEAGGYRFYVQHQGQLVTAQPVSLKVPGLHNVQNALAALVVAKTVGLSPDDAAQTLSTYTGTERRFEVKGEINGITIIDDYAHHPTEIKVNLAAARARFDARPIWAVFQPHTYSRTKLLLTEFAAAFDNADHVIILDIFPAREKDDGTISSADILARMHHSDAQHIGAIPAAITYLQNHLTAGDILMTFSAGSGYKVGEGVLERLKIEG
jgi:UDP-N-acetylmuramate--alanine ligase